MLAKWERIYRILFYGVLATVDRPSALEIDTSIVGSVSDGRLEATRRTCLPCRLVHHGTASSKNESVPRFLESLAGHKFSPCVVF